MSDKTTNLFSKDKTPLAAVTWQQEEWRGMPQFDQPSAFPPRTIIVHFDSAEGVADFEKRMNQNITSKTKYIYHPKRARRDLISLGYVDEDEDG